MSGVKRAAHAVSRFSLLEKQSKARTAYCVRGSFRPTRHAQKSEGSVPLAENRAFFCFS
jgi:hypothetical protein